ncbi:MAG: cytochrome b [Robiginitomaculum sp.]
MSTSSLKYTRIAIWLHWIMAFLLIAQLAGGFIMHAMEGSPLKWSLYGWHKSFGICILLLAILRLIWRLTHKAPALPSDTKPIERLMARLTHIGFYGLMIGIPMAGWLMVSASETPFKTTLFKLVTWPDFPLTRSKALQGLFSEAHELMAFAFIGLLVLHLAAAYKHHFIAKNNMLSRMIPNLKPRD